MRGQVKEWCKLTDDELDQANGNAEQIVGLLQQKYGYTRERPKRNLTGGLRVLKRQFHKVGGCSYNEWRKPERKY